VTKGHRSKADDKIKQYPVGIVLYQDIVQKWLSNKKGTKIISIMHPVLTTFEDEKA